MYDELFSHIPNKDDERRLALKSSERFLSIFVPVNFFFYRMAFLPH